MTEPILARLGHWVADLDYRDIPADTLRAARYQVLDMVATVHAAVGSRETASLTAGLSGFSPAGGSSTVFATGQRHPPAEAALVNAGYSMAQDFDDIVWMGHTCHSAVFAPLAVAEHEGLSAEDFLTAVVVANEIGGRLGASCLLGPLNGQMQMWTFIHLVVAAADPPARCENQDRPRPGADANNHGGHAGGTHRPRSHCERENLNARAGLDKGVLL